MGPICDVGWKDHALITWRIYAYTAHSVRAMRMPQRERERGGNEKARGSVGNRANGSGNLKMHASVEIGADILSIAGIANTRTVSLFLSRISRHLKYGMRTRARLQQQKGHIGYSIQR